LTYDAERNALDCYTLALRMMALRRGSRHFRTLWEMYWLEGQGLIP